MPESSEKEGRPLPNLYSYILVSQNTYKHRGSRINPVSVYIGTYTNTEGEEQSMYSCIRVSWNTYKHREDRIEPVSLYPCVMEHISNTKVAGQNLYSYIRVSQYTYQHRGSRINPVSISIRIEHVFMYPCIMEHVQTQRKHDRTCIFISLYNKTNTHTEREGQSMYPCIRVSWNTYKHRGSRI